MALTFRAVSAVATGTTSLSISMPTGTVENDLMRMVIVHKGTGFATVPAGWTLIEQDVTVDGTRGEAYWKRAALGEAGPYSVTGLADTAAGFIDSYSGGKLSGNPVNVSAKRVNTTTGGCGSITTTVQNCLILASGHGNGNNAFSSWGLAAGAMAEVQDGGTINGTDCRIGGAHFLLLPTTSTGILLYTDSSTQTVGILFAFEPESVTVPGGTFTRFYPTFRSHGVRLLGTLKGAWDPLVAHPIPHDLDNYTFLLYPSKDGAGQIVAIDIDEETSQTDYDRIAYRWCTSHLAAQTISGTLNAVLGTSRPVEPLNTTVFHVHAYITVGDTAEVRHTLLNDFIDSATWANGGIFSTFAAPVALTSGSALAGDRVMVEIGCRFVLNGGVDLTVNLYAGSTDVGQVPYPDAVAGATNVTTAAGYVDFSVGLTLLSETIPPPANDACVDATVISSLPYQTLAIDTTEAVDPDRTVWFTWIAPTTGRYFLTAFESNYYVNILVRKGGCGALVNEPTATSAIEGPYQQRSQAVARFEAVSGTQYWFMVFSSTLVPGINAVGSGGSLKFQLWAYQAPIPGDLFINAQHIFCWRDGIIKNINQLFFGTTPSGIAIDYTRRAIDDLNGGQHTADRILDGLFGFVSATMLVLDLDTLNEGETEVNTLDGVIDAGGQHVASAVLDGNGNVIVGFYGQNYSPLGTLSPAPTFYPIRANAIHGDTPGGFPVGQTFAVDPDVGGSDFVEIAHDSRTLFYTSAGREIKRYDLTTDVQLTDFALLPLQVGVIRPGARGFRLLPPGDGSGGLLVCYGNAVLRVNSTGTVIQSYVPTDTARAQDLHKVELTLDGLGFWVGDELSLMLWKFNLATGAEEAAYHTGFASGQLSGIVVYEGFRAGTSDQTPSISGSEACPAGQEFPVDPGSNTPGCDSREFPVE